MNLVQRKKIMEERKKIEERRKRLEKKPLLLKRISKVEREKLARQELARLKGEEKAKRVREKFEEGKRTDNRTLRFLKKGNEASTVTKYKTMAGENVVLKSYKIGKKKQWLKNANKDQKLAQELYEKGEAMPSGIITEKGMKGRFAFQKEAFKRGLAVSEPIIIKKEGDKIIWKEREARGENIEEYYESTRYHNEIKPTSEKHLKQLIREEKQIAEKQGKMEKAYGKEIRKIIDFYKEKQTLGEVRGMTDYLRQNAIYNEKTGKVTFTDLGTELIKKKKKN